MARRARVDAELVRRGLARSRDHAQELISAGRVLISGAVATKPATAIEAGTPLRVVEVEQEVSWASRGAHKLIGALDTFGSEGLTVEGRRCLDAGASTGGFTDVLLTRGAKEVVAVDVGYGQLVWRLQSDDRVHVI
ncbi:MAG: SAM-dependent methyltransferase, partial [Rhodococcus sp. (in: high G+C Gram-positive bacteria)]